MLRESFIADKRQKVQQKKVVRKDIDIQEGEEVLVKTLNQNGKVLRIIPESSSVQVQSGILKLIVSLDDVVKIQKKKTGRLKSFASLKSSQVRSEVDLRGMTADEAIMELETYLDRAMLNGYHEVYIIHGKGTMVLRKKVHEFLRTCRYITEFKAANQNEGGVGCTVAILK